jgi:hypothetical protein
MIKKSFKVFCASFLLAGSILFCKSPFEPSTNLGQQVLNSIDSSMTNVNTAFKVMDRIDLSVQKASSRVSIRPDTGFYHLRSGVYPYRLAAGRFGDDSSVAYAEFRVSSANLATIRAAVSDSGRMDTSRVDSVILLLQYKAGVNDLTDAQGVSNKVNVFSCGRKFYPGVRNDLTVPDIIPSSAVMVQRTSVDTTVAIPLGSDMVTLLKKAIEDTVSYSGIIGKIDTVFGTVGSVNSVRPDTLFFATAPILQPIFDTLNNVKIVDSLKNTLKGDTAFISYYADAVAKCDTLLYVDSISDLTYQKKESSVIISYSALRFRKIAQSMVYDSTVKYIGSVHIYVSGGGIDRFMGPPDFKIIYRPKNNDSLKTLIDSSYAYYDMTVTPVNDILPSSLTASWQTERFVEVPLNLLPLWDSLKTWDYTIIQNAMITLPIEKNISEFIGPSDSTQLSDTTQTIVYGLFDSLVTDEKSLSTLDSLMNVSGAVASSRLVVGRKDMELTLRVTDVLQKFYEKQTSMGYIYLFMKTNNPFGQVVFVNSKAVKLSAVFSNHHL